jgi:hypothetical protein
MAGEIERDDREMWPQKRFEEAPGVSRGAGSVQQQQNRALPADLHMPG